MDFSVLISVKGNPNLSFVINKKSGIVSSMSIKRYNQLNPEQIYYIPEYLVTNILPNSHYITLSGMVINSLNDITRIIGDGTVIKIILRVNGGQDVNLYIGGDEGRVVETHVKMVSLRKQQELAQRQFQTIEEFTQALNRIPSLQELAANAADPTELARLKRDYQMPGGKKSRNKKHKKRRTKRV
jgi:hypothetical protein